MEPPGLDRHPTTNCHDTFEVSRSGVNRISGGACEGQGVLSERHRRPRLVDSNGDGVRTGKAIAKQNLRDAGAVCHRDGHLKTLLPTGLERGLSEFQSGLGRQLLD